MRYSGQAYELSVSLEVAEDAAAMAEAFHQEHERIYGFRDSEAAIEIGTLRLAAIGAGQPLVSPAPGGETGAAPVRALRPLFHRGGWCEAAVHDRAALGADAVVRGPAIVEQPETTVVVLPGWAGRVDSLGNLLIERSVA